MSSDTADQLRVALQLVEESRRALLRIPARPGGGADSENICLRLTAAVNQLAHSHASIPHELRFHALFPATIPADNEQELLGTRQSAELQQEGVDAEAAAITRTDLGDSASRMATLQARINAAAKLAIDDIHRSTVDARRAILSE